MSHSASWKEHLADRIPVGLGREIDAFETQMHLRRQGKMDEKLFAETRLRRGAYGQRYDNGQRFDGSQMQPLKFPEEQTKGPDTLWHAPGMLRIKIPFGGLNVEQMETLADLAEEYPKIASHPEENIKLGAHF